MSEVVSTKSETLSRYRQIFEPLILLTLFGLLFGSAGQTMGLTNLFNTLFNTAHQLLLNTVFYLMGITVLAGAVGRLLMEFHVISLLEKLLVPLMRPLFNLPGRAAMAAMMTFFSDNPAIISLAKDKRFNHSFKTHEIISLTNFGTAFGMGSDCYYVHVDPEQSGRNVLFCSGSDRSCWSRGGCDCLYAPDAAND